MYTKQQAMKLALSTGYVNRLNSNKYHTISLMIDAWFHCLRGIKEPWINYPSLALYIREQAVKWFGIRWYKGDTKHDGVTYLKRNGQLTKFTLHNVLYHMILDMDLWQNLNIMRTKHNEKTNKPTKTALKRGSIIMECCNRIMYHKKNELKCQYLIEGGAVDDDGNMDPYNGQHSIDDKTLSELTNAKSISIFYDMKYSPKRPEYNEGSQFEKRVVENVFDPEETYGCSPYNVRSKWIDQIDKLIHCSQEFECLNQDDGLDPPRLSYQWYREVKIWRNRKPISLGIGSLVCRVIKTSTSNKLEYLLIVGMGKFHSHHIDEQKFVIGHVVSGCRLNKPDTNFIAFLRPKFECWNVNNIVTNAFYAHYCDKQCQWKLDSNSQMKKVHCWKKRPVLSVFWYLGPRKEILGDPFRHFYFQQICQSDLRQ